MLWGWTFKAFKTSRNWGYLIKRPSGRQGVNGRKLSVINMLQCGSQQVPDSHPLTTKNWPHSHNDASWGETRCHIQWCWWLQGTNWEAAWGGGNSSAPCELQFFTFTYVFLGCLCEFHIATQPNTVLCCDRRTICSWHVICIGGLWMVS